MRRVRPHRDDSSGLDLETPAAAILPFYRRLGFELVSEERPFPGLSIDIGALEARRDRLVAALADMGYQPSTPKGTFYVMAKAPIADDVAFGQLLADEGVVILPGTVVEVPGWFRISLTANDAMVEASLPGFERARAKAIEQAVAAV